MMSEVRRRFHDHRNEFDQARGRIICAVCAGAIALPDQVAIMREQLGQLGLEPIIHQYEVPADESVGRGTVLVVGPGHHWGYVGVYVEDRLVS